MANPHKGEVGFDAGGTAYKLSFSANALCELEDQLDKGINEISEALGDAKKLRLKTLRAVFWAGLLDHHEGISIKAAGEIVTMLGVGPAVALIGKAFERAFPEAEAEKADPPKPGSPADGTGPAS